MITHYAGLQLQTVSLPSVRHFYHEQMRFPIAYETDNRIAFQPTPHVTLTFVEAYEPVTPVHIAFEVPMSRFAEAAAELRKTQAVIQKWPDGKEIDVFETGENIYFRDCDGNLLELIAHRYLKEDVLAPTGPFHILYLREVGFPVDSVPAFREWLRQLLGMKLDKVSDEFTFVIGGTAHAVVVSKRRKWIPVSMLALPPKMEVTLGVSSYAFLAEVKSLLHMQDNCSFSETGTGLRLNKDGYTLHLTAQTAFDPELPALLNLPFS
ncbi:VOC family protein [Paenibacillus contaminans]|uniref:Glyoxalase/bleomycin resistance/dioxygenase family protein n=1 Tax=Paenibacillus contaminans TaxID=450362 RepID=A0A329MP74_9BACL|nr:VOC family protein [Paenibacillus contaminans]RAV21126.1 glyoxalase/bleomycin resistance/dioxygenase family protein [Paenibacillus contaminans]